MTHLLRASVLLSTLLAGVALAEDTPPSWQDSLGPILETSALQRTTWGVQVVHADSGEEVFARHAERRLVPASTMKVITSAAALDVLGPAHSFTTDVFVTGDVVNGVLDGDLIIQGHGDPTFTVERLWRLLRDLRLDGIERVQGDLIFDATYFEGDPVIPGWDKAQDLEEGPSYFPSIGALQIEFGVAVIVVRPGGEVGKPALVRLETPAGEYVALDASVVTSGSRRSRLEVERSLARDRVRFSVEGSIGEGGDAVRIRRALPDPSRFFMGVASSLLEEGGPAIAGQLRLGKTPEDAERVRRMYSPPLASILMDTNKYSSNYMAETVLRALGAETSGAGTTEAGLEAVRAYLRGIGVPDGDVVVRNGSGLSRETEMAPSVLTAVLVDMAKDRRVGAEFFGSLSIAGTDGTLRRRLVDVAGAMRGKTGTLNGVHTLTGYVIADDGELYAYAFLVNDVRGSLYPVKGVQDDFLRRVMTLGRP